MEIVIKIAIVASVLLIGYNISQIISAYASICEKVNEFKQLVSQNDASVGSIRHSNFGLSFVISVVLVLLTVFSGLVWWISVMVACKAAVTLYCSDAMVVRILKEGKISKKFFFLSKIDSFFNVFFGLAVAVILVL